MPGNEYINIVGETLLKTFSNSYVIDIRKDIINEYCFENNYVKFKASSSFLDFIEREKLLIHSDYIERYIKVLSGKFTDNVTLAYKKKELYSYENYVLVAQKTNQSNHDLIIIMIAKVTELNENIVNNSNEIGKMINDFSESILKIYNTMDIDKDNNPSYDYIKSILEDLTKSYPSLNDKITQSIISEANKAQNTLLIVDDDIITRNILKKAFEQDFNIVTASNGKEAIEILDNNYNTNDIVLNYVGIFLDIAMPVLDGFAVLDYLKEKNFLNKMPVIIISAAEDKQTRQRVYNYNIADMLEKPFNLDIIRLRINNFINLYKNSNYLTNLIINKDKDINLIMQKIEEVYFKDNKEKLNLISRLTEIISLKYLEMNPNCGLTIPLISKIVQAIKYYDIGKILVPNKILDSQNLSIDDEKLLTDHPINGSILVKRLLADKDPILNEYAYNVCLYHHENFDGSGYPKRISGKNIPLYVSLGSIAIMYVEQLMQQKDINFSSLAANIIALENKNYSPEIIKAFRAVLNDFVVVCQEKLNEAA